MYSKSHFRVLGVGTEYSAVPAYIPDLELEVMKEIAAKKW